LGCLLVAGLLLAPGLAVAKTVIRVTVGEYSPKTGPYFAQVKAAFEKANPDIELRYEIVSWDTLQQKLVTDISGGDSADLAIIGTRWLVDFVKQGVVSPLDADMNEAFRSRFIPVFLNPQVIDGKTYGLPIAASARAMYYNKEIMTKAGIDQPPATWKDMLADCEKIKASNQAGSYCFGLQGKLIETDIYYYYALWTFGGNILGPDGKSGLTSEAALNAAKLYQTMIHDGYTEPSVTAYNREDVQNMFKQGHIGFMITAPWLASQIKTEAPSLQYGVAPIPVGTQEATYGVTDSIIMFDNSKHKAEAWKLLDFLFQPDWRATFTLNEGFLPVETQVAQRPEFADSPTLKAFTALLPYAKFAPLLTGWEQAADATISALQRIYLGQAEPAAALAEAAQQVNKAISQP
jgi:multiple sugar transport system substrate-binding protein